MVLDDILAKRANCDEADSTVDLSTPLACSSPDRSSSSLSFSSSTSSTQTPLQLSNATPRKLELRKQLRLAKDHIRTLENRLYLLDHLDSVESFLINCEKFLSPNLILIIKSHLMQKERKKGGYRYNNEMKQFALTIYFLGPKVYNFIKTTLSLPTISTLKRTTTKFEILPGLNDFLFNFINFKTRNYTPEALQCILCADEMSLKTNLYYLIKKDEIMGFNITNNRKTYEPAKYALVLMLSGINVNWKQPIAYFLVSSSCTGYDLQDIIISTIIKIQSTSLDIKAFITDMGSNFVGFSNNFHVSPSRPYFEVNNKKIVYIFDPPHLLKATRNMFFQHKFKLNEDLIEKKYLVSFYNQDSTCNLHLAPKLTYPHIYPNAFQKMRVYLAAQTFSATVAAGMETYLELNKLPISSKQTINFFKDMDKLFDIFNSYKRPNLKDFNRPFKNTQSQKSHLLFMEQFFTNLKVFDKNNKDVTNRMKFIKGWLVSIAGLNLLWTILKSINPGHNYVLYTNRLNQDRIENLFSTFRNQNGNNMNPTPVQFYYAFKKIFCLNYFQYSDNSNCIQDFDDILSEIPDPSNKEIQNIMFPEKSPFKFKTPLPIGSVDYRDLTLPDQNSLTYVCGYLMKKCLEKHSCDVCINYAKFQQDLDQSFLFSHFKSYTNKENSTYGNLMMPHNDFYNYIHNLESVFIHRFPILAPEIEVGKKLKLSMFSIIYNHPCESFDKNYLLNLFVRFRIFSTIKFLNKDFFSEKSLKKKN